MNNKYFSNQISFNGIIIFYIITISCLVSIDKITKTYYNNHLSCVNNLKIFSFLDLTLVYNYGAAFGILSDNQMWQKCLLISIGVVASISMIIFLYELVKKNKNNSYKNGAAFTLILSGAIGNLSDRISYGYVIDFISIHYNNVYFPVFNIADIMISIGFLIFIKNEIFLKTLNKFKNQ